MTVCIRQVERGDADSLAAVHVGATQAGYRGLMSDDYLNAFTIEKWVPWWREHLSGDEMPPIRVAVRDGAVVGFCTVATPSRDADTGGEVAEVEALNVSPDAWRSGIGTALMNDALDRFRSDGWQVASLWVADSSARAQGFYQRLGFEFDGASAMHEKSGARIVRMRLPLTVVAG